MTPSGHVLGEISWPTVHTQGRDPQLLKGGLLLPLHTPSRGTFFWGTLKENVHLAREEHSWSDRQSLVTAAFRWQPRASRPGRHSTPQPACLPQRAGGSLRETSNNGTLRLAHAMPCRNRNGAAHAAMLSPTTPATAKIHLIQVLVPGALLPPSRTSLCQRQDLERATPGPCPKSGALSHLFKLLLLEADLVAL